MANRQRMHINARSGSGGVGVSIRCNVLEECDVKMYDNSHWDILWIRMVAQMCNCVVLICVCYLPPIDSCRFVNAPEYLDTLNGQIYKYQNEGILCIARDVNGRCGLMDDFIACE